MLVLRELGRRRSVILLAVLLFAASSPALAASAENASGLARHRVSSPSFQLTQAPAPPHEAAGRRIAAWNGFVDRHGDGRDLPAVFDRRTGRPALVEVSEPWVPGAGNSLTAEEAGVSTPPTADELERIARRFLEENRALLGVRPADLVLDREATVASGDRLHHVVFDWAPHGRRVEGAHVFFRLNAGNLVQFGVEHVTEASRVPHGSPGISGEAALAILAEHVGGFDPATDRFLGEPELVVMPEARGEGLRYRRAWRMVFQRGEAGGTWSGTVDAGSGDLLYFGDDSLHSQAPVRGHIRPEGDASGSIQVNFPFADYRTAPRAYANANGIFSVPADTENVQSSLQGRYAYIYDQCENATGSLEPVQFEAGAIDFGSQVTCGADDTSGNTMAARTTYYYLTQAKRELAGRFSSAWFGESTRASTSVDEDLYACGGSYTTGDQFVFGTARAGICANGGEISGIIQHEFGHGVDDHDGSGQQGDRSSAEAYADLVAYFLAGDPCIGRGIDLSGSFCAGDGEINFYDCACNGLREINWSSRSGVTEPHDLSWALTTCKLTDKPKDGLCGGQQHCESQVVTEAAYRFVQNLHARGFSWSDARAKLEDMFYASRPSSNGSLFTCSNGDEGGATSGSLFYALRAADEDCDGDPSDGTRYAAEIFEAFDRHEIAVGAELDPANRNDSDIPVASFTHSCDSAGVCTFDAGPSTNATTFQWKFGDGSNPRIAEVITHDYLCTGTYAVELTAWDACSQSDVTTQQVFVDAGFAPPEPVADFTITCGALGRCTFDASGSQNAESYAWDFGDGSSGSGDVVEHQFPASDTYSVELEVSDVCGRTHSLTQPVTVNRNIEVMAEHGEVVINHVDGTYGTIVNLSHSFTNPVVIAQPLSRTDFDAATFAHVTNVASDHFRVKLVSEANLPFGAESLHWLVVEAGVWEIQGSGALLEAGTASIDAAIWARRFLWNGQWLLGLQTSWDWIALSAGFSEAPVVFTQTNDRYRERVSTRNRLISASGFRVAMEPFESAPEPIGPELLGWVAVEKGGGEWSGTEYEADVLTGVTDLGQVLHFPTCSSWTQWDASVFGSIGSFEEPFGFLRWKPGPSGTCYQTLEVQEDTVWDAETSHAAEDVHYLLLNSDGGLLNGERLSP